MRLVLTFVLVLSLAGCTSELPTSDLKVEDALSVSASKMQLVGSWYSDYSAPHAVWTVGDTDYHVFAQNTGNGKPFEEAIRGRAWFWEEYHEVYNEAGDLVLTFTLKGFMNHKWKWHCSGTVLDAFGEFSTWNGRHVNGMGPIEFKADGTPVVTGVLRLH